ncbi:MAG TPA: hypothetical protein V6C52_04305 [Coleofasciculaceae cyanobacterium]|jgi:hypothetical protein
MLKINPIQFGIKVHVGNGPSGKQEQELYADTYMANSNQQGRAEILALVKDQEDGYHLVNGDEAQMIQAIAQSKQDFFAPQDANNTPNTALSNLIGAPVSPSDVRILYSDATQLTIDMMQSLDKGTLKQLATNGLHQIMHSNQRDQKPKP